MEKMPLSFDYDPTLRMLFAFSSYVVEHPQWVEVSQYSKKNKEIATHIWPEEEYVDDYFLVGNKFYSCSMEKEDTSICCHIKEFSRFYELADSFLELSFSYHLPSGQIIDLSKVGERKKNSYQRVKTS